MTPRRWRQIDEIFQAASEVDPAHRDEFLTEACGSDAILRTEVERLIAALEEAGDFIEGGPPLDIFAASDFTVSAGRRIGAYEVIREIGRGGMGTVYLAARADEEFRKQVAIKLVQAGMDHDAIVRRFRNERQILANLDHPNIARLLDGGTTDSGWPYFVMEYIEGQPIREYCDAHQLSLTARLELFQTVCSAVQYAHQRLVVHRDIKPGNILVTADGIAKLLDFGIAKLTSPAIAGAEMTEATSQAMTPEYASPEQVSCLPLTTATDIYSLGVLLYELLTGSKPYRLKSRSPLEIAEAICRQEPEKPSAMRRELKGDLDNIVLKAMQKEPRRRYASVEQFADDIRRYLEGRPVGARTATLAYRADKFVRRHKAGVAAAVLVLFALAAGAAATLWQARVALRQRVRAERRFNDVRKLANSFLFEFHDAIRDLPGSTAARSLVVKRGLEYLESLAAESHGDASLMREIATAYERLAEVQGNPNYPNLGDPQGALASYRKALAMRESLARAERGNAARQRELAWLHAMISEILSDKADVPGALSHSGEAVRIYAALADRFANDFEFQSDMASVTYRHADLLMDTGDLEGSLVWYRKAVDLSRRIVAARPWDPAGKIHLATSLDGIGGVLQRKGDTAHALEDRRQALALREDLVAADSNNTHYRRQLGFAHHNVGLSLAEAGDLGGALAHFRVELKMFQALREADPKDAQALRNVSLAYKQVGDVLIRESDWNEALGQYSRALEIDRQLSATAPENDQAFLDLSFSEGKYGQILGKLGRTREALMHLGKGVELQEAWLGNEPNNEWLPAFLANSYTRVAQCLAESGDTARALVYYRKALDTRLQYYAKRPGDTANRGALAECYLNLGKALPPRQRGDALEADGKAIALLEGVTAADTANANDRIRLADACMSAARLRARMKEWDQARQLYLRSRALWAALEGQGKVTATERGRRREVERELASLDTRPASH